MLFDDQTLGPRVLANPALTHQLALQALQDRLDGTNLGVADPNNGFMFLLDAALGVTAQYVRYTEHQFDAVYPARVTRAEELARHMADFDYVHRLSHPASLNVRLVFDRDYLTANAVAVSAEYAKVVIPSTSVFTIGTRRFGLYYPIEIRINRVTGGVVVTHDTATKNPLFTLPGNLVDALTYTTAGLNLLVLRFPVYQFAREVYVERVTPEQGFTKSYRYTDKFYALRAFTERAGVWTEMDYTLSEDVYDRTRPTVKLTLLEDEQRLLVTVPQIYFTRGLIGERLRLELHTTHGALDVTLTADDARAANVSFELRDGEASTHSAILDALPTIQLMPEQTRLVGGSNGIGFEELRRRVVNRSLYAEVPVTPLALQNYVADEGFALTKHLDNITNRIYYANRPLLRGDGQTVPVTMAQIVLNDAVVATTATIRSFVDQVITLLPTTLYTYTTGNQQCVPVGDTERQRLAALRRPDLVDELNATTYTRSPFHLVVYTNNRYPRTKSFNLMTPAVNAIRFVRENANSPAQLSVVSGAVIHKDNGTGGYTLRLGVIKSEAAKALTEAQLTVLLLLRDRAGRVVHTTATRAGATQAVEVYEASLPTDYHIAADRYLRSNLTDSDGASVLCEIPLQGTIDVRLLAQRAALPTVVSDPMLGSDLPSVYADWLVLGQQELTVTLGEDLSTSLFNPTTAVWSQQEFARYPETIHHTYPTDVYQVVIENGRAKSVRTHAAGEVVLDSDNLPSVKHLAGEVKRDAAGNPIVIGQRDLVYYVEALMLGAGLYASEAAVDTTYLTNLPGELAGYAATVAALSNNLLERTNLYFRPTRTIGTARFGLGNGESVVLDLALSFTLRYYVPPAVLSDQALQAVIRQRTKTIIDQHMGRAVISLTAIKADLRAAFGAHLTSIDAGGINNTPDLQTLIVQDEGVTPMIKLKSVYNLDGTVSLAPDVLVQFVSDR